jgi:tetratricopeptide (TPR) repeat protein
MQRPVLSLVPWELILLVTWVPGSETEPAEPPTENSYWLQKRALELDPKFAPAHALLAQLSAYHALYHPPMNTPEALQRAQSHALRALELAPYDSEVLYQVAHYYRSTGDRSQTISTLKRVLELQPSHPLALIDLIFAQHHCEHTSGTAIIELGKLAAEFSASSPTQWVMQSHLAQLHLARGEFELARDAAERSRQILKEPTSTAITLSAAQAELGEAEQSAAILTVEKRQWTHLDMRYFAREITPRWCLGGSQTPAVQATFTRLADTVH